MFEQVFADAGMVGTDARDLMMEFLFPIVFLRIKSHKDLMQE